MSRQRLNAGLSQPNLAAEGRKNAATAEGRGLTFERKYQPILGAKESLAAARLILLPYYKPRPSAVAKDNLLFNVSSVPNSFVLT